MTGLKGTQLKQKIAQGQKVFGTWVGITDPAVTRMFTQLGFDFLLIDLEHSMVNRETLQAMLLMFSDTPTCPIVRVPWHEPNWSKWALDAGAEGILFPNVTTAEQARRLAAQCKYPPEGERGFFPLKASNFLIDLPEYMDGINERIQVWMQIEHVEGIRNMDEILKVPGLDAVLIGPADLSFSLGVGNQYDHPSFEAALEEIFDKARQAGMPVAYHMYDISEQALQKGKDASIFSFGFDIIFARLGALQSLEKVRSALKI
jgi:2-dehydro-3-deoxyglucarate aldolase